MGDWIVALGALLLIAGCFTLAPSVFLQRRFPHLVAPRPVVLIVLSSALVICGLFIILLASGRA